MKGFHDALLDEFRCLTGVTTSKLFQWRPYLPFLEHSPSNRTKFYELLARTPTPQELLVKGLAAKLGSRPMNLHFRFRLVQIEISNTPSFTGVRNFLVLFSYECCTNLFYYHIYELHAKHNLDRELDFLELAHVIKELAEIVQLPISNICLTNKVCSVPENYRKKLIPINYLKRNTSIKSIKNKEFDLIKKIRSSKDIQNGEDLVNYLDKGVQNLFNSISSMKIKIGNRSYKKYRNDFSEESSELYFESTKIIRPIHTCDIATNATQPSEDA